MQMKLPTEPESRHRRAAIALAQACIPSTDKIEGAGVRAVEHTEMLIGTLLPESLTAWRTAQLALSEAARAFSGGKALHEMAPTAAEALVARWTENPLMRAPINGVASVYKITHFDLPDTRGTLRSALKVVDNIEEPRWLQQIMRAEEFDADEEIECDVVVIGSGAGGAVVGKHLADQGHAVVWVEEGENVRRNEFPRNFMSTMMKFYRNVMTIGNNAMLVPQGRLVGGSTAVNTGTSFRPPRWVTDRWCEEMGTDEFSSEALKPYLDQVESILQVEPADTKYAGPSYDRFAEGAKKLGWHHETVRRNAPGCQGEGMCDNGCPTDARRSVNIAYLPSALEKGNMVLSGLRAEKILMEGGRAVGVEGVALDTERRPVRNAAGREKKVRIKAAAVIVAGGAFGTPQFLLKQGLANSSGELGKNLTLHPSGPTAALFDQPMNAEDFIPQTIYSHQFLQEGIMLLMANAEAHMMPPLLPFLGRRLMHIVEQQKNLANFGFLIAESSRGRIRVSKGGKPLVSYTLNKKDVAKMHRGQVLMSQLLLAGGAREVFPGMLFPVTIRDRASLERYAQRKVSAKDFLLTSYHPLGTARMHQDPRRGVVDMNHQCHDVPGLFIVDSSNVSGPLGVNPQISVMAFAARAADKIGPLLDDGS